MGWSPVARSITRRRWIPRPTPASTCRPRESGPRCSRAAHIRSSVARSPGRPSLLACPTIPHTWRPSRPSLGDRSDMLLALRRRIAFIDYFATPYRRRLYEELARRMDADFYFFADERERYWNRKIPLVDAGEFRRIELRRYRIAGQAVMPGLAPRLHPGR